MGSEKDSKPFVHLGGTLKRLRQAQKESLAEAAGAVELNEEDLLRIEQGYERPSEEILMLLIKHFAMREDDAVKLWELAGYDGAESEADEPDIHSANPKSIVMTIALDPRIMYTDSVQIQGSKHGIVFTFMQPGSGQTPIMPISRVGMSRDQARKMLEVLQDTLRHLDNVSDGSDPKQLPPAA